MKNQCNNVLKILSYIFLSRYWNFFAGHHAIEKKEKIRTKRLVQMRSTSTSMTYNSWRPSTVIGIAREVGKGDVYQTSIADRSMFLSIQLKSITITFIYFVSFAVPFVRVRTAVVLNDTRTICHFLHHGHVDGRQRRGRGRREHASR
jgi:hypothetical protein